jgi:UDP-N-acetylglucosamine acyltransferase
MAMIDPRAVVAPSAVLADDVSIGPAAVIGPGVKIGRGTVVSAHAVIEGRTEIGSDNWIGPFAYLGGPPQHAAYQGEDTAVIIGDRNRIREYVTVHRGTVQGHRETRIGSDCFIMLGCHIAHDCLVGSRVIMANLSTLAGHVTVEDDVVFGGFAGVHQFCRVGCVAMVAAGAKLTKDVPPYALIGGDPPTFAGLNRVGLRRVGMGEKNKVELRRAYRVIFGEKSLEDGLKKAEGSFAGVAEVQHVIEFFRGSTRGVTRSPK